MSLSGKGNWRTGRKPYSRKVRNKQGQRSRTHFAPARLKKVMKMTVDQMISVESGRAEMEREVHREAKNKHRDEYRIALLKQKIAKAEKELHRLGKIHRALENEKDKDL
jgi:CRISPR/Cas system CSM-associated protein Csm4 (group 5 of RAMP superfamily)